MEHTFDRDEAEQRKLLQSAGFTRGDGTPLQILTVHRYHPREELGSLLGMLNFEARHVDKLIRSGFEDAVNHDCMESGCILP